MSDNKLQFPLTVCTDGEEFIINKEEDPTSPNQFHHDYDGDRGRSKRRRRCGQCGPCQVKENCNKCNFCLRRDVLKQTCIYRKCVYLRSKPKPYPSPQGGQDFNQVTSPPPSQSVVKNNRTPPASSLQDGPIVSGHNAQISQTSAGTFNPFTPVSSAGGPNFSSSDSLFKPPVPQFSHPSQPSMAMGISSPENVLPPQIPPYNPQTMPQIHSGHSSMTMPPCVNDKMLPRSSQESSSFSSPFNHQHVQNDPLRYDSYFNRFSRTTPTNDPRTNLPSPCMHHPGLPSPYHGTTSHVDRGPYNGHYVRPPTIPPYLPPSSNMLRHFSSLPQRYPMHPPPPPTGRYGDGYSEPSQYPAAYNSYGLQPTDMQMPIHGMSHHHPFNTFSNINRYQPPQYEQSSTCPKNVCGPPAFPSLALGTLRVQERPQGIHNFRCNPFYRPLPWEKQFFHPIHQPNSAMSDDSSKMSSASSGFECDVICIDDMQMNAYIRSDGCNSIEIEIEDPHSPNEQNKYDDIKKEKLSEPDVNCNYKTKLCSPRKITVSGLVTIKQDLGDEGLLQLDIPGNKVILEESALDFSLAKYSCNIIDLLKFIETEPRNELEIQNEIQCN